MLKRFEIDCVHHHAVRPISDPRDFSRKARVSAVYSAHIFRCRSLAGGICGIGAPVSGRKNPVPGAM